MPRQPPPPPPNLATMYASQLAQSQIELFQKQLCSDVDYVIYPLQDPAISQQEYLDAKQGSIIAAMAQNPPSYLAIQANHGWDQFNGHAIYRSPLAHSSRYASTQNLSDTYVQLPYGAYSPLYSPSVASLCSSYDAAPPIPLRPGLVEFLFCERELFLQKCCVKRENNQFFSYLQPIRWQSNDSCTNVHPLKVRR